MDLASSRLLWARADRNIKTAQIAAGLMEIESLNRQIEVRLAELHDLKDDKVVSQTRVVDERNRFRTACISNEVPQKTSLWEMGLSSDVGDPSSPYRDYNWETSSVTEQTSDDAETLRDEGAASVTEQSSDDAQALQGCASLYGADGGEDVVDMDDASSDSEGGGQPRWNR